MREILFEGKRKDNGEWIEGYFGVFVGIPQIYVPFTEEQKKENEGNIIKHFNDLDNPDSYELVKGEQQC